MTTKVAYSFLKPSLEQFSMKEKEELCRLIMGENASHKPNRKEGKHEDVKTVQDFQFELRRTIFK